MIKFLIFNKFCVWDAVRGQKSKFGCLIYLSENLPDPDPKLTTKPVPNQKKIFWTHNSVELQKCLPLVIFEIMFAVLNEGLHNLGGHKLRRAHRGEQLGGGVTPAPAATQTIFIRRERKNKKDTRKNIFALVRIDGSALICLLNPDPGG